MLKIENIEYKKSLFGDGTLKLNFDYDSFPKDLTSVNVMWYFESESELLELIYLVKSIRKMTNLPINLHMPYIPNSRMDRVENNYNDVFTLKYFSELLNSLEFKNVFVLDPHSNVSLALINNVQVNDEKVLPSLIKNILNGSKENKFTIMFPDAGAEKRYKTLFVNNFSEYNFDFIIGQKIRNWKTGKIESYNVLSDNITSAINNTVIIIDDICSYGGTFVNASKKLVEMGFNNDIHLCVTHCENSIFKGDIFKDGLIKKVFTTNSIVHECPYELESRFDDKTISILLR